MPDAWGQRVIIRHLIGSGAGPGDPAPLGPLSYLLASGSDRIGALHFQASSEGYEGRNDDSASLEELLEAALRLEQGEALSPSLDWRCCTAARAGMSCWSSASIVGRPQTASDGGQSSPR